MPRKPITPAGLEVPKTGKPTGKVPTNAWPKGCSGNPAGSNVRWKLGKIAREKLQHKVKGDPLGRTWGEFIVDKWLERAASGSEMALRSLLYYVDGPPKQMFEHLGSESAEMTDDLRNEILTKLKDQLSRGDIAIPKLVGAGEVTGDVAAAPDPGNPLRLAGDVGETGPAST